MHVTWCCVSVLKSDPKIPKSRDRRQNLVATVLVRPLLRSPQRQLHRRHLRPEPVVGQGGQVRQVV